MENCNQCGQDFIPDKMVTYQDTGGGKYCSAACSVAPDVICPDCQLVYDPDEVDHCPDCELSTLRAQLSAAEKSKENWQLAYDKLALERDDAKAKVANAEKRADDLIVYRCGHCGAFGESCGNARQEPSGEVVQCGPSVPIVASDVVHILERAEKAEAERDKARRELTGFRKSVLELRVVLQARDYYAAVGVVAQTWRNDDAVDFKREVLAALDDAESPASEGEEGGG